MDRTKLVFLSALGIAAVGLGATSTAWAWGNAGHEIVAVIAADNLSPAARDHVAKILGTGSDLDSIEKAMAAASIRPDTEFIEEDRSTARPGTSSTSAYRTKGVMCPRDALAEPA